MKAFLFNWLCLKCREWRGIDTIDEAKRCKTCGDRCVWAEYVTDDEGNPKEIEP